MNFSSLNPRVCLRYALSWVLATGYLVPRWRFADEYFREKQFMSKLSLLLGESIRCFLGTISFFSKIHGVNLPVRNIHAHRSYWTRLTPKSFSKNCNHFQHRHFTRLSLFVNYFQELFAEIEDDVKAGISRSTWKCRSLLHHFTIPSLASRTGSLSSVATHF